MKKLLAILGIIVGSIPAYSAQWSGANVNPEAVKAIFEKYVQSADKVEAMLRVLNDNMDEKGTLNARGFARTCRAGGLKGPAGSEGYRNCEELVQMAIKSAKVWCLIWLNWQKKRTALLLRLVENLVLVKLK